MTGVVETQAQSQDVEALADRLIPHLEGKERGLAAITLLTLVLSIMNPNITPEEIQTGVRGASEWLCLYLSSVEDAKLPEHEKRLLN